MSNINIKMKMSRWDYDVVFYRVFCVTLLAVAFTFTVILTNVFVDIDGLLTNKKRHLPETSPIPETFIINGDSPTEEEKEQISNEYKNYDSEINPSYRTKRSIEPLTIYDAKSPVLKKILTRRLASLLKELDDEEAKNEIKLEIATPKTKDTKNEDDQLDGIRNEDLLHLAMHNIILQGLIGHMDLNDVYKKVHVLVRTFNKRISNKSAQDEELNSLKSIINSKEILKGIPDLEKQNNYNEEHQFLNELIKCKDLEERLSNTTHSNETNATNNNLIDKDDKLFIKTVIEINESHSKSKAANRTQPKENIEGLIKLIYNGKSIKIKQMDDEIKSQITSKSKTMNDTKQNKSSILNKNNNINTEIKATELKNKNRRHTPNPLFNRVLEEYLKKNSLPNFEYLQNSAEVKSIKNQRLKRQIKIRHSNNMTSPKINSVHEGVKKDDDDLYIEIETHFDGKGIKGGKKKKLVKSLIDKIQKALHSDMQGKHDNVEHIKFVKRTQDPIYSQNQIPIDKKAPLEPIEHRLLDPIGKTLETHENIANRLGDTWKKQYYGPNFLSISKAINSAEMNEVNIEYDSILKNSIPTRLQKPLHTELGDEGESTGLLNSDSSNVTLFLKDVDGSGFSIGFNQYEGEPPDKDSMKMFNGLEDLIREYHQTYDEDDNFSSESPLKKDYNLIGKFQETANRNVENLHKVHRRSITEVGANSFNANMFKIFVKEDPSLSKFKRHKQKLKFHNRNDNIAIYNENNNNDDLLSTNLLLRDVPIILDERILSKKLQPSELLTISNLVNRKRRSVHVKRISNLKSKIKLNRYLNTKTMEKTKKVFMKNKRNKRHVNNIRVIARNPPKASHKNSDENIFFTSKENSYSDKETMIRAVETAKSKVNYKHTESFDEESPFNNIYRIQNPYSQTTLTENVYSTGIRSNGLMSKYPHIFLDKSLNSNEEIFFDEKQYRTNVKPYRIEASTYPPIGKQGMEKTTEHILASLLQDASVPKFEEMVDAIMPPLRGTNYRITVKMSPKNKTNTNAGFKEVHTSVNKSYDDNGVRYYTLLNVSQISKIEKLNKTDAIQDTVQPPKEPPSNHLIDQQNQIKTLLKLHKKRVDLQLNNLLKESNHLQKMIESNKEHNINNTIKLLTDDNGLRTVNEDKLITDSARKLQGTYSESEHLITTPTSSKSITVLPSTTETVTVDKIKIIDTIKQNEKVTLEILKKIDTNTQILQNFLEKFSARLNFDKKEIAPIQTTEKPVLEMKLDLSKDWKSYGMNKDAFYHPNESKNDTVPFVYAYQQSIPMKSKTPQSLVSLVYHGHIHTNTVQNLDNDNFKKPSPKIEPNILVNTDNSKRKLNESKFFMEELNDFKVIPTNDRVISAKIKINTTNIIV